MKWAEAAKMDQQIHFPTAKETQKVRQQSSITPAFTPTPSIPAKPGHGRAYATPAVHDSLGWGEGVRTSAEDAMEPPAALQARLNEGMDWMGPLLPPGFWGPVGEGSTSA